MHPVIDEQLKTYNPVTLDDYKNALKEILQNIVLAALKKTDFFERGAFYGGTALRIFYGLDRFSEDLDFTLYTEDKTFSFEPYFDIVKQTASAYGFIVETKEQIKNEDHQNISTAFLKTGTKISVVSCQAPLNISNSIFENENLKVKFEADIEPPTGFNTEELDIKFPESCTIKVLDMPSLLAGKIHAILYRSYRDRVKGRDYYDFEFLINKGTKVNLNYLKNKIKNSDSSIDVDKLTIDDIKKMLIDKISSIDLNKANDDLESFINTKTDSPILVRENLLSCVPLLVDKWSLLSNLKRFFCNFFKISITIYKIIC